MLNIKDIALKMQGEGPKRMVVQKQGRAPSRQRHPDRRRHLRAQSGLQICTLDDGARSAWSSLSPPARATSRRAQPPRGRTDRLIPVDSCSPRPQGLLQVENTREGQILDYKLTHDERDQRRDHA